MKKINTLISLLRDGLAGNKSSLDEVKTMIYEQLKKITSKLFKSKQKEGDFQLTVKMRQSMDLDSLDLAGIERAQLLTILAGQVRRVLNEINTDGKNIGSSPETMGRELGAPIADRSLADFLLLDRLIQELSQLDKCKATLIELTYFGGMNYEEIGQILSMPVASIDRELRFARAWLCREIAT